MKELFTVGEIAELFHINIRTLRYYDDIGILHPEVTDSRTGYRYYSTRQFERLNTIKYLRALDMPLKKIALFFENRDVDILKILLEEQRRETGEKINALKRIEKKLEHRLRDLEDALEAGTGEIRLVACGKRRIAFLRREISLEDNLEYPIRELERANMLEPVMFLGKVGVSVSLEDLNRRSFGRFSGIFVLLEDEDNFHGEEKFLPPGEYAVLRFPGTHREAEFHYCRLLDELERRKLRPAGDSVEITLIDGGFTNDVSKYVTELRIPVEN